jgi:putative acetyltransferase
MSDVALVEGDIVDVRRVNDDADFEQLHGLLLEYEAALPPDLRHGVVGDLAAVRVQYSDPHAAFVARDGARGVGCIGVTRRDARDALILRLYVPPEQRGRGTARRLVEAVLAFARAGGFERAVLDTDKTRLTAAYALYESLGFTECAPYGPVDYASPTYMELRLR